MIQTYNHQSLVIDSLGASKIAVKGIGSPVQIYTVVSGAETLTIDTAEYAPGEYQVVFYDASDAVLSSDTINVKQNLIYAADDYDPRSANKIAYDAITAFLEHRATAQQRRIKVGDKEIEYSSFDELMRWKTYFASEVRREQGKMPLRHEILRFKR